MMMMVVVVGGFRCGFVGDRYAAAAVVGLHQLLLRVRGKKYMRVEHTGAR